MQEIQDAISGVIVVKRVEGRTQDGVRAEKIRAEAHGFLERRTGFSIAAAGGSRSGRGCGRLRMQAVYIEDDSDDIG